VDTIVDDGSRDVVRCRWLVDTGIIDYSVVNGDGSSDAASRMLFPPVDFCVLSAVAYSHEVVTGDDTIARGMHVGFEVGDEPVVSVLVIQLDVRRRRSV